MARSSTVFVCSECGHRSATWMGRCGGCGEWNTLVEERAAAPRGGGSGGGARRRAATAARPVPLADVEVERCARLATGVGELDRVLGGGIVPGSLVLLGGSPGIGKSTLLNQALGNLAAAGRRTLYVSAEESAAQVRLRAERLGPAALAVPMLAETSLDGVLAALEAEAPAVCVVDSVQTVYSEAFTSAPGSVGQVREVAGALMRTAKERGTAVLLVGHVTKEGSLAGPRVLEHLVDCVLQFEGERERTYRVLRALKNRFGSTNELGVFEMRDGGLEEVGDASARFIGEATRAPGSCLLAAMEGSRPLIVEVQALVAPTDVVPPRRIAAGVDRNRLSLILAVLSRHGGVSLGSADVFVSLAGGVRIDEPGADLAVALAVASAARGVPVGGAVQPVAEGGATVPPPAAFGELGLTGEVRYVGHPERRVAEARKFGIERLVVPRGATDGIEGCASLRDALRAALPSERRRAKAA